MKNQKVITRGGGIVFVLSCAIVVLCFDYKRFDSIVLADDYPSKEVDYFQVSRKYNGDLFSYEHLTVIQQDMNVADSHMNMPHSGIMLSNNHYYIADTGNHRIAVYDNTGLYLDAIGQHGHGPGDLFAPAFIRKIGNDQFSVRSHNGRTTFFSEDGTLLDVIPGHKIGDLESIFTPSGGVAHARLNSRSENLSTYIQAAVEVIEDGVEVSSVESLPVIVGMFKSIRVEGELTRAHARIAFCGQPDVALIPNTGYILSSGTEPKVDWFDFSGQLTRSIELLLAPERVTLEDKATFKQQAVNLAQNFPEKGREALLRALKLTEFPEFKPFWTRIFVDDRNHIWLQRPDSRFSPSSEVIQTWIVLSPSGEFLGETTWPLMTFGTISNTS